MMCKLFIARSEVSKMAAGAAKNRQKEAANVIRRHRDTWEVSSRNAAMDESEQDKPRCLCDVKARRTWRHTHEGELNMSTGRGTSITEWGGHSPMLINTQYRSIRVISLDFIKWNHKYNTCTGWKLQNVDEIGLCPKIGCHRMQLKGSCVCVYLYIKVACEM